MTDIVVRVIDCHVMYKEDGLPKFLILKRSHDKIYPGIWQCVTGKIEPEEEPIESAIRELKEETSLNPVQKWTIDIVNHFYESKHDRMNLIPVFGVEVNNIKVVLSDEHCNYRWCEINEALKLLTWNQQKKGLIEFNNMLTGQSQKLSLTKII